MRQEPASLGLGFGGEAQRGIGAVLGKKDGKACADLGQVAGDAVGPAPIARGKAVMDLGEGHDRGRDAQRAKAQVHVALVQIEGETFVEAADPGQDIAAESHVGALGLDPETGFGAADDGRLIGRHVDGPALAQPVDQACAPLQADPVAPDHEASCRADGGIAEGVGQAGEPERLGHGIIVEEGDDVARRRGKAEIAGGRDVRPVEGDGPDPVPPGGERGQARGICHDDHLEAPMREPRDPAQAARQRLWPAPADDDHADRREGHATPIRASIASMRGTSSGLLSSQKDRPRASTSTQRTGIPFSRKRSCSSPSSVSSGPGSQPP